MAFEVEQEATVSKGESSLVSQFISFVSGIIYLQTLVEASFEPIWKWLTKAMDDTEERIKLFEQRQLTKSE